MWSRGRRWRCVCGVFATVAVEIRGKMIVFIMMMIFQMDANLDTCTLALPHTIYIYTTHLHTHINLQTHRLTHLYKGSSRAQTPECRRQYSVTYFFRNQNLSWLLTQSPTFHSLFIIVLIIRFSLSLSFFSSSPPPLSLCRRHGNILGHSFGFFIKNSTKFIFTNTKLKCFIWLKLITCVHNLTFNKMDFFFLISFANRQIWVILIFCSGGLAEILGPTRHLIITDRKAA